MTAPLLYRYRNRRSEELNTLLPWEWLLRPADWLSIEHRSHNERRIVPLRYYIIWSRDDLLHTIPYKWIQWTVSIIRLHSSSFALLGTMADLKMREKGTSIVIGQRAFFPSAFSRSYIVNERLSDERTPIRVLQVRQLCGSLMKSIITKGDKKLATSFEDVRGNFRLTNLTLKFARALRTSFNSIYFSSK